MWDKFPHKEFFFLLPSINIFCPSSPTLKEINLLEHNMHKYNINMEMSNE